MTRHRHRLDQAEPLEPRHLVGARARSPRTAPRPTGSLRDPTAAGSARPRQRSRHAWAHPRSRVSLGRDGGAAWRGASGWGATRFRWRGVAAVDAGTTEASEASKARRAAQRRSRVGAPLAGGAARHSGCAVTRPRRARAAAGERASTSETTCNPDAPASRRAALPPARRVGENPRPCASSSAFVGCSSAVAGSDAGGRPARRAAPSCRSAAPPRVVTEIPVGQPVPDDLEGEEVLALLAQDPAEALDVVLEELAVARWGALGIDQPLALEEPDLRDGDVGELLPQEGQHVPDGEIGAGDTGRHSFPATR